MPKSHAKIIHWRQVVEGALLAVDADEAMARAVGDALIGLYGPNAIDFDRFVKSATEGTKDKGSLVHEIRDAIRAVLERRGLLPEQAADPGGA